MPTLETAYHLALLVASLLCNLCFGFVLLFYIVIMPGISKLDDGAFLRAFQVMDGVIQNNQPVFVATWIGSVIALYTTLGLNVFLWATRNDDDDQHRPLSSILLVTAVVLYTLGQYTTVSINIPLNNRVKALDMSQTSTFSNALERQHFEHRWNTWNLFRSIMFGITSVLLLFSLLKEHA